MQDMQGPELPEQGRPAPNPQQLVLPKWEQDNLVRRIMSDYMSAERSHEQRRSRFASYADRWRRRVGMAGGIRGKSNFAVPLIKSQMLIKWAKVVEQMLGEEAEVVGIPTGPSDAKTALKIGRYMTWRLFKSMNAANDFVEFVFNYLLYGRAHAYVPYTVEMFDTPDGEQIAYEGPGFKVINSDDLIVPNEQVKSIQDFSFAIIRYDATLNDLLKGEEAGEYQGIREQFPELYTCARGGTEDAARTGVADRVKDIQRAAEGIASGWGQNYKESLEMYEWYGWWRMLSSDQTEASDTSGEDRPGDGRDEYQTELKIRIIPKLNKYIGGQRLMDIYPTMPKRRPIVEISLIKDGSYWSPSLPEFLEPAEDELTVNHNLGTEAVQFSVGPLILYRPGTGFDPGTIRYEPYLSIPCDDPSAVNVIQGKTDIGALAEREHTVTRWAERLWGLTDQQAGRASDRPNAVRTVGQSVLLDQESNVRILLDTTVLRIDLGKVCKHLWEIDSLYSSPEVFFRVTEQEAKGLFETEGGGSTLTQAERAGNYDFQLKFASTLYSREARKADALMLYKLDLANPLIMQNPRALWIVAQRAHAALGDEMFSELIPEPPETPFPMTPEQEWTRVLQGEDIHVHPEDNDSYHRRKHDLQVAMALTQPDERQDRAAIMKMLAHNAEHDQQEMMNKRAAGQMQALLGQMGQRNLLQPGGLQPDAERRANGQDIPAL